MLLTNIFVENQTYISIICICSLSYVSIISQKASNVQLTYLPYTIVIYLILHWTLENKEVHAEVSKLGIEKFYKKWNRCLTTMPKIILGKDVGHN